MPRMKTRNNLHHEVCSVANLLAAARTAMRGKLTNPAPAAFLVRWETHAVTLAGGTSLGFMESRPLHLF